MRCWDDELLGVCTSMLVYVQYSYIWFMMIYVADSTEAMLPSMHSGSIAAHSPLQASRRYFVRR